MIEKLRKLLNEKSKEDLKSIWDSGNHLDSPGGYKITDWLKEQDKKNFLRNKYNKK